MIEEIVYEETEVDPVDRVPPILLSVLALFIINGLFTIYIIGKY